MADLLSALGLAFVLEGILYALFPQQMRRALETVFASGEDAVRRSGLLVACVGIGLVWLARG